MTNQSETPWDHNRSVIRPRRTDPARVAAIEAEMAERYKQELTLPPIPESFISKAGMPKPDVAPTPHGHPADMRPWLESGLPIPPEVLANVPRGWKLHLNFDPDDAAAVEKVAGFLDGMKGTGHIRDYKIGGGGGAATGDAAGKEATVYIGHRDQAELAAQAIDSGLGSVLLDPEGAAVVEDRLLHGKVMGRFDMIYYDPDFMYGGENGHSMLVVDHDEMDSGHGQYAGLSGDSARRVFRATAMARADELLKYRYGEFYAGSGAETAVVELSQAVGSAAIGRTAQ